MSNDNTENKITRHLNKINSLLNELQKIDGKVGVAKVEVPGVPDSARLSKEEDQSSDQPSAPVLLLSSMPEFRKKVKDEKIKQDNNKLVRQIKEKSEKKPS
jgi:hypothetical protein